jgi:hypothetical protein
MRRLGATVILSARSLLRLTSLVSNSPSARAPEPAQGASSHALQDIHPSISRFALIRAGPCTAYSRTTQVRFVLRGRGHVHDTIFRLDRWLSDPILQNSI